MLATPITPTTTTWTLRTAWIVLVLGSIPFVFDYVEHILSHSWAWYAGIFPIFVVSSLARAERRSSRTILAILLILFGITVEIYASASGMLRLGCPGFVLAASGILAADGRLDVRRFIMMALAIPIPHAWLERIGEPLLFLNIEILTHTLQAMSIPALATAQGVERPAGLVLFNVMDVGWTSAIFAFGLAWVLFERRRSSWTRTLVGSGVAALMGLVVHLLCTTTLFALVDPSTIIDARTWRDVLSLCVIAVGARGYFFLRLRANPRTQSCPVC
jgi:hypothetical protein